MVERWEGSWSGDCEGHCEGKELVVESVGFGARGFLSGHKTDLGAMSSTYWPKIGSSFLCMSWRSNPKIDRFIMSSPTSTTLPKEIRERVYDFVWDLGQIVSPSASSPTFTTPAMDDVDSQCEYEPFVSPPESWSNYVPSS